MIVFEDLLAKIVGDLPNVQVGNQSASINFNWGTEEVLFKYLALKKKLSFPLIWLVEGQDTISLTENTAKRTTKIVILHESQAPQEFNTYQHEYDFKLILQPILDNLLKAFTQSGISRYDKTNIKVQRIKNYSMQEVNKSLTYVCNAIVLDLDLTLGGFTQCLQNINYN